jgi:hypothetical protein
MAENTVIIDIFQFISKSLYYISQHQQWSRTSSSNLPCISQATTSISGTSASTRIPMCLPVATSPAKSQCMKEYPTQPEVRQR